MYCMELMLDRQTRVGLYLLPSTEGGGVERYDLEEVVSEPRGGGGRKG